MVESSIAACGWMDECVIAEYSPDWMSVLADYDHKGILPRQLNCHGRVYAASHKPCRACNLPRKKCWLLGQAYGSRDMVMASEKGPQHRLSGFCCVEVSLVIKDYDAVKGTGTIQILLSHPRAAVAVWRPGQWEPFFVSNFAKLMPFPIRSLEEPTWASASTPDGSFEDLASRTTMGIQLLRSRGDATRRRREAAYQKRVKLCKFQKKWYSGGPNQCAMGHLCPFPHTLPYEAALCQAQMKEAQLHLASQWVRLTFVVFLWALWGILISFRFAIAFGES